MNVLVLFHGLNSRRKLLQLLSSLKQCGHSSMQQCFQALDRACEFCKSTISDSRQSCEVIVQHDFLRSNGAYNDLDLVNLVLQAMDLIHIEDLKAQVQHDACTSFSGLD